MAAAKTAEIKNPGFIIGMHARCKMREYNIGPKNMKRFQVRPRFTKCGDPEAIPLVHVLCSDL